MKRFTMLALAAAVSLTLASGQDFSRKISFSGPPMTAKKLLEELSKQAEYKLDTSPQTANEVIYLNVADVSLGDLMKRIAEATSAEWQPETGIYRLVRTNTLWQKIRKKDLAARAETIKGEIAKVTSPLDKQPQLTESEAAKAAQPPQPGRFTSTSLESSPGYRAMLRMLRMIDPEDIATMSPGTRKVFSTYATRMQVPVRGNVQNLIKRFLEEQATYVQAYNNAPREAPADPNTRTVFFGYAEPKPVSRVGKVLLAVTRWGASPFYQLEVMVSDEKGQIVGRGNAALQVSPAANAGSTSAAGEQVKLSQQTIEFAKLFGSNIRAAAATPAFRIRMVSVASGSFTFGPQGPEPPEVSPELRAKMSDPQSHDPAALLLTEMLDAAAAEHKANTIAVIPDRIIPGTARQLSDGGNITVSGLMNLWKGTFDMNVSTSEGWLTISSKYPSEDISTRLDRSALAGVLRKVVKPGYLRLDDQAEYAEKQQLVVTEELERCYLNTFARNANLAGISQRLMLRFYATLPTTTRQNLANGARIQLSQLSSSQSAIVKSLVFDLPEGPSIELPVQDGDPRRIESMRVLSVAGGAGIAAPMVFNGFAENLSQERTEAMPNGVPPRGLLAMATRSEDGVLASRNGSSATTHYSTSGLASYLASSSDEGLQKLIGGPTSKPYDKYQFCNITQLSFSFLLLENSTLERFLEDITGIQGSAVAYEQLPAKFRQSVEEQRARIAETMKNISFAPIPALPGGRGGTPPPIP